MMLQPGDRLPAIQMWLKQYVWSIDRFSAMPPEDYLRDGEACVFNVEELMLIAAPRVYDELYGASERAKRIEQQIAPDEPTAFVVLDGASIREIPLFERLASETGFQIVESSYNISALPSDTLSFIVQRITSKEVAPVQLPTRKELIERGWSVWYYDAAIRNHELPNDGRHLLLWSAFPDATYGNFEARAASHFTGIVTLYETVWKNVVQAIPNGYRIILTSDHGYAYFGTGLDSNHTVSGPRILEQARYKFFSDSDDFPEPAIDLYTLPEKRLAVLKGRVKNRPQGPMGNRVYRHGGMSLMEMLTPWLVLKRM